VALTRIMKRIGDSSVRGLSIDASNERLGNRHGWEILSR
jgi:hypothetical protein